MVDYWESNATVEEASIKAKVLVTLLTNSCFNLTKFVSNINNLLVKLQHSGEPAPTNEKVIQKPEESSHFLGLEWNHAYYPRSKSGNEP